MQSATLLILLCGLLFKQTKGCIILAFIWSNMIHGKYQILYTQYKNVSNNMSGFISTILAMWIKMNNLDIVILKGHAVKCIVLVVVVQSVIIQLQKKGYVILYIYTHLAFFSYFTKAKKTYIHIFYIKVCRITTLNILVTEKANIMYIGNIKPKCFQKF